MAVLVELIIGGAIVHTFRCADKCLDLDERALKKYAKAFERNAEAELMVKEKSLFLEKRLQNVVKKKRAIIQVAFPRFVEVYGQIQKIALDCGDSLAVIPAQTPAQTMSIHSLGSIVNKKDFTDKELVCGMLTRGFGNMMVKDSERFLSAAQRQLRAANVVYSQAESICTVCDAVIARADRISNLLMGMNALFMKSIAVTKETIVRNGLDVRNYSEHDKGILMTCVNMAVAMTALIDVPAITAEGEIAESAVQTIATGEKYLSKMNQEINK